MTALLTVALRKESVDRNAVTSNDAAGDRTSLSARRAWIEIRVRPRCPGCPAVALRKESVDRNNALQNLSASNSSRSPQGERG